MSMTFEDRVSTRPNRYKITPDSGDAFYGTLERADEPSTLGTPLNAATFNTALSEKAPAGCGYGDRLSYLNITDGTFEAALDEYLADMEGYSARQIQLYDTVGLYGNKFVGTLWKYTANYVTLEALCYSNLKAVKRKSNGQWFPWEWVNPPMIAGTEYRTVERYDGKVVYTKLIDMGSLPSTGTSSTSANLGVQYSSEATRVVSLDVILTKNNNNYPPPFYNSTGALVARAYATLVKVNIDVWADLSTYTARAIIKYTKD